MLQSSNGFIIDASFIGLSTNSRQFFYCQFDEMGTRYKKFSSMANQCC